jgi:hypothetical protein
VDAHLLLCIDGLAAPEPCKTLHDPGGAHIAECVVGCYHNLSNSYSVYIFSGFALAV